SGPRDLQVAIKIVAPGAHYFWASSTFSLNHCYPKFAERRSERVQGKADAAQEPERTSVREDSEQRIDFAMRPQKSRAAKKFSAGPPQGKLAPSGAESYKIGRAHV